MPHPGLPRRRLIGAALGAAAGSGALTGFPTIWAQNIREITLQHAGPPVTALPQVAEQATRDLGFTVRMQASEGADLLNRFLSQSSAIDVADVSITYLKYLVGRNVLQTIPLAKMKHWDQTIPLFTKGEYADGQRASTEGVAPYTVLYAASEDGKAFAPGPTEWLTSMPSVTNADTLGIRPDKVGRPIESWSELLNPEFKGKASLLNIPSIGIMDAAMAVEAMGRHKYADKGNMTRAEIDLTMRVLTEAKRAGQFRAFWKDFNESVNLMASGETVIQSMWSPAVTAVRSRGIPCTYQPLKEGYRAWAAGFGLPKTLSGRKLDAAYEFINWFLSGWAGAFLNRQGYYSAVLSTAQKSMEPYEWDFWMMGKPAAQDIKAPDGTVMEKAGAVRDGGSFEARMGAVACWNAVMDENDYMVRKWNEFIAA